MVGGGVESAEMDLKSSFKAVEGDNRIMTAALMKNTSLYSHSSQERKKNQFLNRTETRNFALNSSRTQAVLKKLKLPLKQAIVENNIETVNNL